MKAKYLVSMALLFANSSAFAGTNSANNPGRFDGKYKLIKASAKVSDQYVIEKPCMDVAVISHRLVGASPGDTVNIVTFRTAANQGAINAFDGVFWPGTPNWNLVYSENGGTAVASEATFEDRVFKENDCGSVIGCALQGKMLSANFGEAYASQNKIGGKAKQVISDVTDKLEMSLEAKGTQLNYNLYFSETANPKYTMARGTARVACTYEKSAN